LRQIRRILIEGGADASSRATYGFRLAVSRKPNPKELASILSAFDGERQHFLQNPKEAEAVSREANAELAAWTIVSNSLLNLNETLSKE